MSFRYPTGYAVSLVTSGAVGVLVALISFVDGESTYKRENPVLRATLGFMRSFSELADADLHWEFDTSPVIPFTGDRHYVLFRGSDAMVTAQCKWEKFVSFQAALEAGEGTYFVHMDLTASPLQAVVWKAGTSFSAAGFLLTTWSTSAFAGTITTAGGRQLTWQPKTILGLPTNKGQLLGPDHSILLSVVPKTGSTTSGKMTISPALAADPDCAALITLAFALCNEQALFLHLAPGPAGNKDPERRISYRLHAHTRGDSVGAVGAVTTGKLGLFISALLLGSFFLWIFSTTLEVIDIILLSAVVLGLSVWSSVQAGRPRKDPDTGKTTKGRGWTKLSSGAYMGPDGSIAEGPLADLAFDISAAWHARQARKVAASVVALHDDHLDAARDDGVVTDA